MPGAMLGDSSLRIKKRTLSERVYTLERKIEIK